MNSQILNFFDYLEKVINNVILTDILISIFILALVLISGKIFNLILRLILKPLFEKTQTKLDDLIINVLIKFDNRAFWVIGLYFSSNYFMNQVESEKRLKKILSPETYNFLVGASVIFYDILFIAVVSLCVFLLSKLFNISMDYYADKKEIKKETSTLYDFIPLLRKVILIILITIGILIILNHFKVNVSGLIVSLGVGSLAIALAAQETLANMIAGFVILIDRPFREGDRIKLPTGEVGDIYKIGMRSTKILDFDNNLIIVPNSILVKSTIQNMTYPDYVSRVFVDVEVSFASDINKAKQILIDIAKAHPLNLKSFEPLVYLIDFKSNGVLMRLIARTDDYRNVYQIQSDMREEILRRFKGNNIEIPYSQVVIHNKGN